MEAGRCGGAFGARVYSPGQVVCVECSHVREMAGETDEVVRRTRSEAAESAVLGAVRGGGVEPDWFVERWIGEEGRLVACAVFEDEGKAGLFRAAVVDWIAKREAEKGGVPIRLRADEGLERAVAGHFTAEWARIRAERMGTYRAVLADARACGRWAGRVLVGEFRADGDDARRAFGGLCEALNESCPRDEFGDGGIAYSGYWDEGGVARFAFGFPDAGAAAAARGSLGGIGAVVRDPLDGGVEDGAELEMAALVIAKMQKEDGERKAREEIGKGVEKAVKEGVEKGIAEEADRAMA